MPSSGGRYVVVGVLEGIALALAVWFVGAPLVVPVFMALTVLALALRGLGPATVFVLSHLALGLAAAVYLVAEYLYWLLQLLGGVWVLLIVNHFASPREPAVEVA